MTDKDTLIQETLLAISSESRKSYGNLPKPIQIKLNQIFEELADDSMPDWRTQSSQQQSTSMQRIQGLAQTTMNSHDGILPFQESDLRNENQKLNYPEIAIQLDQIPESNFKNDLSILSSGNLRLEINSSRENLYGAIGCFGPILVLILFVMEVPSIFVTGVLLYTFWGIRQRVKTDDFLEFDPQKRQILFQKNQGVQTQSEIYIALDKAIAIAVQGRKVSGKHDSWWEYKPIIVDKYGNSFDLADFAKVEYLTCYEFCEKLAKLMNVRFYDKFQPRRKLEAMTINELCRAMIKTHKRKIVTTEEATEQTEFDVILKDAGTSKISIIKVVREATGLGLKDSKALIDGAPKAVKQKVSKEDAEKLKEKLEAYGAIIEIQQTKLLIE